MNLIHFIRQRLTHNSLLLTGSILGGALINFAISIRVGHWLGESEFGRWVFLLAWASVLTMFCEFGLHGYLTREAAKFPAQLNQLLLTSLSIKLILIGCFGWGLWMASPFLGIGAESGLGLRYSVLLAAFGVAYASFTSIFRATGWVAPIFWINLLGLSFQYIGAWSLSNTEQGLISLMRLLAGIDLLQVLTFFILWYRFIKADGGETRASFESLTAMTRGATPFAIANIIGAFQLRSSPILLGYVQGPAQVGFFGAATRLSEAAKLVPNGLFDAIFPILAAQRNDKARTITLFHALDRTILLYAILTSAFLIVFSGPLLRWTYGTGYEAASPSFIWLGIAILPTLMNAVPELYLYATGDEKYATSLGAAAVMVQLCIGLPLMLFSGATGAAIGLLCGEIAIWLPLRRRIGNRII